ncbi:fibrillarin-like rRNA/tRNA 2'-O-methyltransferase [Methanothermobacter sp.]|uniref:fibrillarin-like rRNA/tRNA 2'-O-methyltransferase n=1 Tax=Methanothermobacter sp. TaxID=1884223 RepID=UPI003C75DFFE
MKRVKGLDGVFMMNDSLLTVNLNPGVRVYGEKLMEWGGREYRVWDPRRSKLAAAIHNGLRGFSLKSGCRVLYLGASAGTTASHISDIVTDGRVYCVEFSPRMMRELLEVCSARMNMLPLLEDASRPRDYLRMVEAADLVYCDIAQPDQTRLFTENMEYFLRDDGYGLIMIKARSIDVTRSPRKIFREEVRKLRDSDFQVIDQVGLNPYEKDHMAVLVKRSD